MSKYKTEHYVEKKRIKDPIDFTRKFSMYNVLSHEMSTLSYSYLYHSHTCEQVNDLRLMLAFRCRRNFYRHIEVAWSKL